MRASNYHLVTLKETPADAEIISHQLMLRAGLIRKLAAGIYSWLPLGFKVLQKVEHIVRQELNKSGAQELLLPAIQPAEIWQESDRWDNFVPPLLKFKDRHARDFCYGPTHEEVITTLMRGEIKSYKQLPLMVYQIQHKFRDELRPRSGVMRAREFLMKDAYSFNTDEPSLQRSYDQIYQAYCNIFEALGLEYRAVLADSGAIGGSVSHEFQVLTPSGEDTIAISDESDYAANIEKAEALAPQNVLKAPTKALEAVATPDIKSIEELCQFLQCSAKQTLKTLIVKGSQTDFVALVLRGDHTLNEIKAEKLTEVAAPLQLASDAQTIQALNLVPGFIGPVDIEIPVIVDRDAAVCSDFICGANQKDKHLTNVNWQRDIPLEKVADIREVVVGDLSPDGKGKLKLVRGIEAGHIFQLGTKYSEPMNATFLDENGKSQFIQMGCYGFGVSRIVAATIEQNHDENGIIWPEAMAPFQIAIVPIGYHKSAEVKAESDKFYETLQSRGYEVLLDDRNHRPGAMFADMDLIGIPHRFVISDKTLKNNHVEYKFRKTNESKLMLIETVLSEFVAP